MLVSALPAHASVLPSGTLAIAAAGSDTTQAFMNDYLLGTSSLPPKTSTTFNGVTTPVQTYNIPAVPTAAGYTVDEDARCPANGNGGLAGATNYTGTITWTPTTPNNGQPPNAPFGSGAGRSALLAEESVGTNHTQLACIDIGRSSSFSSNASFEYYGFALDAVAWATTSLKAPQVLTRQQVKDIFLCNARNWADVGGAPGPIQRYLPQASSGTFQTFMSEWLDLPTSGAGLPTGVADNSDGSCPDPVQAQDKNGNPFEENQAQTVKNADIDKMIMPYSAGVWTYQKNNSSNPTLDRRNGVRIGSLATNLAKPGEDDRFLADGTTKINPPLNSSFAVQTVNPERWNGTNVKYELDYVNTSNPGGVVSDQNTALANGSGGSAFSKTFGYSGIRFLFNVVDVNNPQSYGPALGLVGFDNTTTGTPTTVSPLCDGTSRTLILSFGFAPLPQTTSTFNKSTTAPTACREFT